MVAALLAQRARTPATPAREDCSLAALVLSGALRHEALSSLLHGGLASLLLHWHAQPDFVAHAVARLHSTIAPTVVFGAAVLPPIALDPEPASSSIVCHLSTPLFSAVLAAGWPWRLALRLFAGLGRGSPCTGGYNFVLDRGKGLPVGSPCSAASVVSAADPSVVMTILFDAVGVLLLSCTRAVFGSSGSLRGPVPTWLVRSKSRFMPDYIRLPRDAHGNMLLTKLHVTALVERRHVWDRLIKMDGTTRALVHGKLCYPRVGWDILP